MKRKTTKVMPDGSKEITEIDDEAPAMRKNELAVQMQGEPPAKQYLNKVSPQGQRGNVPGDQNLAAQGQQGDTQLAHVNPWEQALLKKLGGVGTRNPQTGLKQFYQENIDYFGGPGEYANAIYAKQLGGQTLQDQAGADAFLAAYPNYNYQTLYGSGADMPNLPLDIMPTNTQSSSGYSGLPASYRDQLLQSLMPQLQSSITNMPGNIDQYTNEALGSYQQMMQNALRTNIPKSISGLANRGILSSTEGNKVLSDVYSNAAMDASNKGYTTAMQSALLKAGMPSTLASIADLGKSTSSSSFGYSEDPTVMYRELAATIRAMMG